MSPLSPSLAEIAHKATANRPKYFEEPLVDELLAVLLEQAEENCILRDRLATAETLQPGINEQIDGHSLTQEETAGRLAEHSEIVNSLMRKVVKLIETTDAD